MRVGGDGDLVEAPVAALGEIVLAPVGRGGAGGTPIGRGVSNPDGTFAIDAIVPGDLDLTTYELFVSTRGDARYNPAYSDE